MRYAFAVLLACLSTLTLSAQLRRPVEQFVAGRQQPIVRELVELLSIPNVAADRDNAAATPRCCAELLRRRGFTTEILETEGNPLVFGELLVPGAQRTLLFYAHYDGQPVDPKGMEPGQPVYAGVARRARWKTAGRRFRIFWRCSSFRPRRGCTRVRRRTTRRPSSRS